VVVEVELLEAAEGVLEDFAHLRVHQAAALQRKVNFQLQQAFPIP
jgi:hypothetical protein